MATNVDPAVRAEWFKEMFVGPHMFDWALNVLVLSSGDKTILVDAGLGGQFPGSPRAGQLPKRLQSAGIDLASVPAIITTQLPIDPARGLPHEAGHPRWPPGVRIQVPAPQTHLLAQVR